MTTTIWTGFQRVIATGGLMFVCATALPGQRPFNLDFEMAAAGIATMPWGWSTGWAAYQAGPAASFMLDTVMVAQGRRSLRVVSTDTTAVADTAEFRSLMLQLPTAFARGKTLNLTGRIRPGTLRGRAMVALEAWGNRVVPAADSASVRGTTSGATQNWQPFSLTVRVPLDAEIHSVVIMAGLQGSGTAWFDDLQLRVDGAVLTTLPAEAPPATEAEISWLSKRSAPLLGVTPTANGKDDDLALFDNIVGKAKLVGLGESTHGTGDFFELKHRLLQHLVEVDQFDLFAIEANQLATERLNAFVLGAKDATAEAMKVLFGVWQTEEMRTLIEWMRGYNVRHPARPVRFIGYDMQDHRLPIDSLRQFLTRVAPAMLPRLTQVTAAYLAQPGYMEVQLAPATALAWSEAADSLAREMAGQRPRWLNGAKNRADSVTVEWAVHNADLYRQAAWVNMTHRAADRDSLMAVNLAWSLRVLYPTSRVVVWAHDGHISRGGDSLWMPAGGKPMGGFLKDIFQDDYRALALLTRAGVYSATRSMTDYTSMAAVAFDAPSSSIEYLLARIPRPPGSIGLTVDLRTRRNDPQGAWLWQPRTIRSIGYAAYDYGFEMMSVLPLEFDGALFIDLSRASRKLP